MMKKAKDLVEGDEFVWRSPHNDKLYEVHVKAAPFPSKHEDGAVVVFTDSIGLNAVITLASESEVEVTWKATKRSL